MADAAVQRLADYQALVDLAECECALVQAGRVDELPELQAEWRSRLAVLEQPPPDGAEPLLRRALSVSEQSAEGMHLFLGRGSAPAGLKSQFRSLLS